ncbi:MAG: flavodoxin family protein [Actinobacteria bacterium HGW-Actinobacteria-7]|nr:MAG: flavodoxin family protein [Actinobacteria bacterium HGW-Actinobacteria-7]
MKVVAVNGSARRNGNTAILIEAALEPLRAAGHDCEVINLAGKDIRGCTACAKCREKVDRKCHGRKDDLNPMLETLFTADAILLGSPTYYADITSEMKALIDRAGYVSGGNGNLFARKPGAAIIAVRRAGGIHAMDSINHFFLIGEMFVVGSTYWNVGFGGPKGAVSEDEEGLRTMRRLGENMSWLLGKLA